MSFKPGQPFTVNSRKYDGSISRSWQCEVVGDGEGYIDLVGCFEEAVDHPNLGLIEKGTVSRERFYLDRWYNSFCFEFPAGTLRNYYINICMPPTIGDGVIDYVDLDIDLIVWPNGLVITVDVEEFEANARAFGYTSEVTEAAATTLKALHELLRDLNSESIRRAIARL